METLYLDSCCESRRPVTKLLLLDWLDEASQEEGKKARRTEKLL